MRVNAYVAILIQRGPLLAYPLFKVSVMQVHTYISPPQLTE
jgi:hypothetical protein